MSAVTQDPDTGTVNFALTVSKSEVVALVGDTTYRASPGGLHFHKTRTNVSVGAVAVQDVNVTLASDPLVEPSPAQRRRLEVCPKLLSINHPWVIVGGGYLALCCACQEMLSAVPSGGRSVQCGQATVYQPSCTRCQCT